MASLFIGFALGFGCALWPPARAVVISTVQQAIALFRNKTTEQK